MSHANQFLQISRALANTPEKCVLATLVDVTGSSFRRPGARMLIRPDGSFKGGISAGCLEDEIRSRCFEWTRGGPCVKEFQIGSQEDDVYGWGSGCKGTLSVLFQRVDSGDGLLETKLRERKTILTATFWSVEPQQDIPLGIHFLMTDGESQSDLPLELHEMVELEAKLCLSGGVSRSVRYSTAAGTFSILWEILEPPIQLCVFGSGEGVAQLLKCAGELHWSTVLCDKHSEMYNRMQGLKADQIHECFPGDLPGGLICDEHTAAVVMTHNFADDLPIVSALLRSPIPYVGVLGGRTRYQRLKEVLAGEIEPRQFEKLFAPIGLNIGAEESSEIAIAIAGEIMACLNKRRPGHLKDETESIHKPLPHENRILHIPRVNVPSLAVS